MVRIFGVFDRSDDDGGHARSGGQHTGRGDGAGPQPLEFHGRRAPGAYGQGPQRGGVHVVSVPAIGRNCCGRELHGGGHVRGVAPTLRGTGVQLVGRAKPSVVHRAVRGPVEQGVLRCGLRHGTDNGADAAGKRHRGRRHCSPVRPGHHRAAGFGVRVPSGRHSRPAHGVRGAHAHDHVHATVHCRPHGQPGLRAPSTVRLGASQVQPQAGQLGRVRILFRCPVVLRAYGPPATVRWRPARKTFRRVRQQPSYHRTRYAAAP